jgi:FkbM family methyltransferase
MVQGTGRGVSLFTGSTLTRVRDILRRLNLDVQRYENTLVAKRQRFMQRTSVSVVLDVGGGSGRYGQELRRGGYRGRIVSFEPLLEAYRELEKRSGADSAWSCHRVALGDNNGTTHLHVSENLASSSLLPMLERHIAAAPYSRPVAMQEVVLRTLDSIRGEEIESRERCLLKLDVQGSEKRVLSGGLETLDQVPLIECELSLVPLYEGQPLLTEMLELLGSLGYVMVWLEREFTDPRTGQLLQINGLFGRLGQGDF